jgi:signal transduction histidine kinase
MKEIIEDFDDYLTMNNQEPKKDKILIKNLVDYLNKYYKEDLKEKNIDFKIKSNCYNSYIYVDLPKFKRVFSNIISNSIRYLENNKKIIKIDINETKDKIKFTIADNGSGSKELKKIFEPLYTTDASRKISGLGLSICKEIIEAHNGTIKAENNKVGGLSIIFEIDSYKES